MNSNYTKKAPLTKGLKMSSIFKSNGCLHHPKKCTELSAEMGTATSESLWRHNRCRAYGLVQCVGRAPQPLSRRRDSSRFRKPTTKGDQMSNKNLYAGLHPDALRHPFGAAPASDKGDTPTRKMEWYCPTKNKKKPFEGSADGVAMEMCPICEQEYKYCHFALTPVEA